MRFKLLCTLIFNIFIVLNVYGNDQGSGKKEKSKEDIESGMEKGGMGVEEKVQELLQEKLRRYRPSNVSKLFQEVFLKEKQLKLKEEKITTKESQLKIGEKELGKKILEFQKKQKEFIGCVDKNNREKADRIGHIVKIISNMRPARASDVLSVQEEEVAVKVVSLLDPVKASKIFNLMDKEISARIQKQYLNMKK